MLRPQSTQTVHPLGKEAVEGFRDLKVDLRLKV